MIHVVLCVELTMETRFKMVGLRTITRLLLTQRRLWQDIQTFPLWRGIVPIRPQQIRAYYFVLSIHFITCAISQAKDTPNLTLEIIA